MAAGAATATGTEFETQIPARLDRLPWSRWHWLVVFALGSVWILDGLEVTIVGSIASRLKDSAALGLTDAQIGLAGSAYLLGAIIGALVFGRLTDLFGRKKLFMITLALYMAAAVATAFSWSFASFMVFRFLTGMGIGGEYAGINSAIDELIPARVRGRVDLAINGSWWAGTAAGASLSLLLLDKHLFPTDMGWRLAFALGAVLSIALLITRRTLPESPRWLMTRGRIEEADRIVSQIEHTVAEEHGELPEPESSITMQQRPHTTYREIAHVLLARYRSRTVLGLALMSTQAFLYNAIFFTYALVLTKFYGVSDAKVGLYILPFAVGNFLGPLLLGPLFDTLGRRVMITSTYVLSGVLLAITGWLFLQGQLTATTQTVAWSVIFFFASAGASSGYLTVSELFPLEVRALAIALFYAIGTALGGFAAPAIFGVLIGSGKASNVVIGYMVGAALMVGGGLVAWWLAVPAERKSLEQIAPPVSAAASWLRERKLVASVTTTVAVLAPADARVGGRSRSA